MCQTDAEVDALMARALEAGATLLKPAQKTSFDGYSGYFADLDGHVWEAVRGARLRIHGGWPCGIARIAVVPELHSASVLHSDWN